MSEPIGEAFVRIRPKADDFRANTKKLLSGITLPNIAKDATDGIAALVTQMNRAIGVTKAEGAALGTVARSAAEVSAAARSAAVFQVKEALRVEDALRAEIAGYHAVADAAVRGSREQVAATNLVIDAEKRLQRTIAGTASQEKSAASGALVAGGRGGAGDDKARGNALGGLLAGGAAGGVKLAAGFGLATVAIQGFRKSIDSVVMGGASFETELNTFQVVTGASADAMDRAQQSAVALGQDVKLPGVSAADAAVAMTELAKGGLDVQDSLDGVRGALELGTAANTDFGTSAAIIARNLAAFELPGTKATNVADLLAGASIAATGDVTDMAIALQQSATVAHSAGLSIDDTVTAISQLAKAGLVGSDAGTSLRTMILRLIPSTQKAAEKMADLGVKVLDARGDMLPFPKIIESYKQALDGMSESQRQAALNTIFGQDAIRSATIFARGGAKEFENLAKITTKAGQANALTTARTKGLGGSLGALQSNLETIALLISAKVNPAIKQFVDFVNRGLSGLPKMIGDIRDAFAGGGLGGGIEKIQETFRNLAPQAKVATVAVGGLAIAVAAVAAAAFPLTGLVVASAALAVGLKLAYDRSEQFRAVVDRLKASVMDAAPVWDQLRQTVATAVDGIRDDIEVTVKRIVAVWDVAGHRILIVVRQSFNAVASVTKGTLKIIGGLIDVFTGVLTLDWRRAWGGLKDIAAGALNNVKTVVKGSGGAILGIFQGVWKSMEEEALRGVEAVLKVIARIPTQFSIFGQKFGFENPAKGALESVQNALSGIRTTRETKEIAAAVADNTAAALNAKNRDITAAVEGVTKKALRNAADTVKPDAKNAGGDIGGAFGDGLNASISDSGLNAIEGLQKRLRDAVANTEKTVRDAVLGAQRSLTGLGSGLASQIETVIDEGPLGKAIKRLTDQMAGKQAHQQSKQLRQAIVDAQADLAKATASIANPSALTSSQQDQVDLFLKPKKQALTDAKNAWADFTSQTVVGGLQAQQTKQKQTVTKGVNDLVDQFNRGVINADTLTTGIGTLLEGQSKAFQTAGATLGTAFSTGFNAQVQGLLLQAEAIQKGRDKGIPGLLGQGALPEITQPTTVLGQQLRVQQEILAELRKTREQQQAAANKRAEKAAKKKGGGVDLAALSTASTD